MKKNILFIIGKMQTGGAEKVINNLCNNLDDKYNVTLVVRQNSNADYIPNVKIIEIPELNNGKRLIIGLYKLRKLKKDMHIDTSISFLVKYNIFNYLSKYHDKIIISNRNFASETSKLNSKFTMFFYKKTIRGADVVVNVAKSVMSDQIKTYGARKENNVVIPNFCEVDEINKLKMEELPMKHKKLFNDDIVISSGRYMYQKGQWHLIRAFSEVVKVNPRAKLILTGRGYLKDYYNELVNDLGLSKNVFILDYVDNIYRYIYNSDIYILNSFYEGMPNVILEAMACSIPVIATDSPGGTREIIDPKRKGDYIKKSTICEYGVLIPVSDRIMYNAKDKLTNEELIISKSIINLLNDKKLRDKYKLKSNDCLNNFSKEKILKMWEDII